MNEQRFETQMRRWGTTILLIILAALFLSLVPDRSLTGPPRHGPVYVVPTSSLPVAPPASPVKVVRP